MGLLSVFQEHAVLSKSCRGGSILSEAMRGFGWIISYFRTPHLKTARRPSRSLSLWRDRLQPEVRRALFGSHESVPYTEEELAAMRGGLTVEQWRRKTIRE